MAEIYTRQFGRFLLMGVWNTLLAFVTFSACNYALTDRIPYAYVAASALASVINITLAYLGHKFLVFRTRGNYLREYLRYWAVYGTSTLIGMTLLPVLVFAIKQWAGDERWVPYLAQAILLGLIATGSFVAHLRFSFAKPDDRPQN